MYDGFAAAYAAHIQDSALNAYYDRPVVLDLLGDVAGKRVLDAGCGPGLYAHELVARGAIVTGFDESAVMVQLARERLGQTAEVRQASLAEPLSWAADNSFDLVLMALVLHYLDERVAALRELHRVLRPGGHLVLSTHHPTGNLLIHGGSYFAVEPVDDTWADAWRVRYWRAPLQVMCDEFAEARFVIDRLVEHQPVPEMAERYPREYALLTVHPDFIAFRLARARPD
jgi:SAM-dependent methyltransferase